METLRQKSINNAISFVIRQKGEYHNGGNKKTKYAKFYEKQTLLTPWYAQGKKSHRAGVLKKYLDLEVFVKGSPN